MRTIFALAVSLLIAFFCLAPIAALLSQALMLDGAGLLTFIGKVPFRKALAVTLVTALGGALFSVFFGTLFARRFALTKFRAKRPKRLFLLLPYLVPNFVLATSYVLAWNPGTGLLNAWLPFPSGLYGSWGMTVLFGVSHMPIAFLLLEEKMRRMDASLREAARLSGATSLQVFFRIEAPILLPSLVSAWALSFSLNVAAFAIPAWIGAPERSYTLSYKIYQAIQIGGLEAFPRAAGYGLALCTLVVTALFILGLAGRRAQGKETTLGKAARQTPEGERIPIGRDIFWTILYWTYQMIFWILPLGLLLASTLVPPGCLQERGIGCVAEVTGAPYQYVLFDLAETPLAFRGSFIYGSLSAVFVSALSLTLLVATVRTRFARTIGEFAFVLASATPGAVLALGLIMIYSGRFHVNLYNTAGIVVVAFVIKHLNLAFQPLRTGLLSLSKTLTEAATLAGARPLQVWTKILLPILRPEIVGGFFIVLIPILGELTMSVFLVSPGFRSIGTLLFDLQDYADQTSAAALSVLLIFAILIFNELAFRTTRGRLGY